MPARLEWGAAMPVAHLNGVDLHYVERGEGVPLALLNGVLMSVGSWGPLLPPLAAKHRCLLHDFRGQLLSGKPEGDVSLDEHVDDFLALLDHLGVERCHVVGTSYGGEIGMLFAARHPERVLSLVVVASVAHLEPPLRAQTDAWAEASLADPVRLYRTMLPDTFSPAFLERNPGFPEAGEQLLGRFPAEFFTSFAGLVRAFQRLDAREELPHISRPTLVVSAEDDTLKPPSYGREIAASIPGARFALVPGAGHAVVVEKPEEVARLVLAFLEANTPSAPPP